MSYFKPLDLELLGHGNNKAVGSPSSGVYIWLRSVWTAAFSPVSPPLVNAADKERRDTPGVSWQAGTRWQEQNSIFKTCV